MSRDRDTLGLHPEPCGAVVYGDEPLVRTITAEEEGVQFVLDGLGVDSLAELGLLVERGREADPRAAFGAGFHASHEGWSGDCHDEDEVEDRLDRRFAEWSSR